MATATKTATASKTKALSSSKSTGAKSKKAEPVKIEAEANEQIAVSVLAISPGEIPSVQLPQPITLTKTALQKSVGAFSEAWDYEQEHQLGLELLRLVGRTIRDIGSPLLALLIYGGAMAAEKANTDDAKRIRSERWQRLLSAFSKRTGALNEDEPAIAVDPVPVEDDKKVSA